MLGRVPLHPALVGAFPVLLLWAQNGAEVPPGDGTVVLVAVVAGLGVLAAVAGLLLRDLRRGGLVASSLGAIALSHGHLWGTSGRMPLLLGLPVAVLLAVWSIVRIRRLDTAATTRTTTVANVVAAILVVATLPGVVGSVRSASAAPAPAAIDVDDGTDGDEEPAAPVAGTRDVVWIVPDRHGSEQGLAHTYDLDTSGFTTALEERGFSVAAAARSNYHRTSHALAAALGLDYLDDLAATVPDAAQDSTAPVESVLADHEVGRRFRAAGYEHVHLGSWWGPTAQSEAADTVLTLDPGLVGRSEFAQVFLATTVLHALQPGSGDREPSLRERHQAHAAWQLDELDRLARELVEDRTGPPRFVFVHLLLPHPPYVFDRDGSPVDAATASGRTTADNFDRQMSYLHQRLLGVLDTLALAPDEQEPIVLLQADEGPHPRGVVGDGTFIWSDATDAQLLTKFSILSALRVPGQSVELREDVTAVNVARTVVDHALGTSLGQLPDRSFIAPDDDHLYEFIDVTARLDAATRDDHS